MTNIYIIIILILILATFVVVFLLAQSKQIKKRRQSLIVSVFPQEWHDILNKNFPLYKKLPDGVKKTLHGYINVFMDEKTFEACGELEELTEEMCVTIAGQACLLLVNGRCGFYDKLTTILVYPDMYRAEQKQNKDGTIASGGSRLGESWEPVSYTHLTLPTNREV